MSDPIPNFELILEKNIKTNSVSLYKDNKQQDKHTYNPQDVISSVSFQLKAFQVADSVKSEKCSSKVLPKTKNSNFLSVTKLPVYDEPPKTKFDTQYATDTQLINIIENAEIIDIHQGMTQEFETTFCHHTEKILEEADDEIKGEDDNGCIDVDNDEAADDKEDVNVILDTNVAMDTSVSLISPLINSNRVKYENTAVNSKKRKDFGDENDNIECIEIDDDDLAIEQPLSPIFVQKVTKTKSKTPSPMVFSLEKFEEFEKQVEPVLIGDDFKISKKIINSQILNKELHFKMDEEIALNTKQSPVLVNKGKKKINNEEFKTRLLTDPNSDKDIELINLDKAVSESLIKEVVRDKGKTLKENSEVLKDEILFSSDEEDFVQKSLQDLPFTCALETSFYNQSDVLDKTMYVGFQTASNKSIQIFTDSFAQAKSILDDVGEELTITDLVNNCENSVKNTTKDEKQGDMDFIVKKTEFVLDSGIEIAKVVDTGQQGLDNFKGFMTASNKEIKLSQKALARSRKVFQDIDLNEDFDKSATEDDDNADVIEKNKEDKPKAEINLNIEDDMQNIDDALIEEFENIEMSLNDDKKQVEVAPIGFRTASNKEIEITDTALAKIKDVFKDIDLDEDLNEIELKEDNFGDKIDGDLKSATKDLGGFKTASNKNIHVSKEAISKTKNIFQDLDSIQFPNKPEKVLNKEEESSSKITSVIPNAKADFVGFKTASNKNIKLSSEALAKTKDLFQDIDKIELPNKKTEETFDKDDVFAKPTTSKGFTGFKTANNKQINISKAALAKTKKIFEGIDSVDFKLSDKPEEITKNMKEMADFSSRSGFIGFKTASNKNIKISDEAMARTENIFKDIDADNFNYPDKCTKTEENTNVNAETSKSGVIDNFVGFKTANNKEIKVSDKALAETKNIFKDIDSNDFKYPSKHVKNTENTAKEGVDAETADLFRPSTSKATFVGFKTANNKKVNVSKEALVKTRNIFKDIIDNDSKFPENREANKIEVETEDFNKPSTSKTNFIGFQAANNKNITISKESLAKTKDIFKDIDEISFGGPSKSNDNAKKPVKDPYVPSTSKTGFVGFKTANNKQIPISKESLAKTKNIFRDIDSNDFSNIEKDKEQLPYPSFKEDFQPVGSSTGFVGFKTANNKVINVSEEALAKTRSIFKDLDTSEVETSKTTKKDYPDIEIDSKNTEGNVNNEDESIEDGNFNVNTNKMLKFQGFQTASNKKVEISAEALLKSRKVFENIDASDGFNNKNRTDSKSNSSPDKYDKALRDDFNIAIVPNSPIFKGFQTGNKNPVVISEEALAKSRKLFQDLETIQDDPEPEFHGFQTTNNTEIELSQKALIDAVRIFEKELNDGSQFQSENDKVALTEKWIVQSRELHEYTPKNEDRIRNYAKNVSTIKSDIKNRDVYKSNDGIRTKRPFADVDVSNDNTTYLEEGLENIINTQVLNNFDQSLHTEDFRETPVKAKRSSSPILSCPKAKKRKKFETPYSQKLPVPTKKEIFKSNDGKKLQFKENYKQNKEYSLKDLEKITRKLAPKIDGYLTKFRFNNLLQFVFKNERSDLIEGELTIETLKEYFSNSVNCKLIPNGWLDNHLKLILWKLISYEIKFKSLICTARNVLDQLKFRYDVELFNAKRPALRKIFEKDDVPSKTLVLCVAEIYQDGVSVVSASTTNNIELLLTDGWYCIKVNIDKMLAQYVCQGKIVVGTKLVTNGAELVNCEQGVSPWEDTTAIRLKLFGNSTRRARWDARLGYHGNAAILSQLSSVKIDGGKVSKLRVFVTRVYPALYVEKFEDGSTVTRSERLEHLHQVKTEAERQAVMERIYEEVEREFSDQESQDSEGLSDNCSKRACLDSGSQIAKVMKRSRDPDEFRAGLTSTQTKLLEGHTSKQRDRLLENIQKRVREKIEKAGVQVSRNVVMLLKIRVAGVMEKNGVEITKGMMSIWKPTDAVTDIIREGVWIDVLNVVPTAVRYNEIQISAGRQSIFSISKFKEPEILKPYTKLLKRNSYTIQQLVQNPSMSTDYNEIDTIGFIFLIDPSIPDFDSTKQPFQNVYLSDADKNIICINFWGGLKKFGYENVLDTGQVIYCGNLQKRAGNTRKSIPQYRVTEFTYFTKTPKNECARNLIHDLSKKFNTLDRRKFCEDCVALKNNFAVVKNNNENISPYRFNNTDHNFSKNKIFIDSPLARPVKDDNFNLTGLDFESTFRQTDTQNLSEEVLLRKKKVNEKIAKLKMYGEPPPLSTIHIINRSKNASNSYKSPLNPNQSNISKIPPPKSKSETVKSDSCENVTSVDKTPGKSGNLNDSDLVCSPMLMNRTYVKNVNPVKINFDVKDNNDSHIDHFAEEFDGSPPLSLD